VSGPGERSPGTGGGALRKVVSPARCWHGTTDSPSRGLVHPLTPLSPGQFGPAIQNGHPVRQRRVTTMGVKKTVREGAPDPLPTWFMGGQVVAHHRSPVGPTA